MRLPSVSSPPQAVRFFASLRYALNDKAFSIILGEFWGEESCAFFTPTPPLSNLASCHSERSDESLRFL